MYTISLVLFCLAAVYIFSRIYPLLKPAQLQPFIIILNMLFSLFLYNYSQTDIVFTLPYFTISALFGFSIHHLISATILSLIVFPNLSHIMILLTCFFRWTFISSLFHTFTQKPSWYFDQFDSHDRVICFNILFT